MPTASAVAGRALLSFLSEAHGAYFLLEGVGVGSCCLAALRARSPSVLRWRINRRTVSSPGRPRPLAGETGTRFFTAVTVLDRCRNGENHRSSLQSSRPSGLKPTVHLYASRPFLASRHEAAKKAAKIANYWQIAKIMSSDDQHTPCQREPDPANLRHARG